MASTSDQPPYSTREKRLAAAQWQTFQAVIGEGINAVDMLVETFAPGFGTFVSIFGGVGGFFNNKIENFILTKNTSIFGDDPTRARLVSTGGRLSLLPIVGPYAAAVEDAVTLVRAWLNVDRPELVRNKIDPILNKGMDVLSTFWIARSDNPSKTTNRPFSSGYTSSDGKGEVIEISRDAYSEVPHQEFGQAHTGSSTPNRRPNFDRMTGEKIIYPDEKHRSMPSENLTDRSAFPGSSKRIDSVRR